MSLNRIEAQLLLRDVTARAKALALLRKPVHPSPLWPIVLTSSAAAAVSAGLEASLWVKVLLIAGCSAALSSLVDVWHLSRRVDALVTLTLQQEDARRTPLSDADG